MVCCALPEQAARTIAKILAKPMPRANLNERGRTEPPAEFAAARVMIRSYREDLCPWPHERPSATINYWVRVTVQCAWPTSRTGRTIEYAAWQARCRDRESVMSEPSANPGNALGPVVVGVDGSVISERALLWASEQANLTGAQLRVVLVRTHPVPVTAVAPEPVWP